MQIKTKEDRRDRIKFRIRKRMTGSAQKPRLSVFRSVSHIYVQVIDDMNGQTIASASTIDPKVKGQMPKGVGGGNIKGADRESRRRRGPVRRPGNRVVKYSQARCRCCRRRR
jgi:large subunit ribosomal protein L18